MAPSLKIGRRGASPYHGRALPAELRRHWPLESYRQRGLRGSSDRAITIPG
jgi:hypothetical protein